MTKSNAWSQECIQIDDFVPDITKRRQPLVTGLMLSTQKPHFSQDWVSSLWTCFMRSSWTLSKCRSKLLILRPDLYFLVSYTSCRCSLSLQAFSSSVSGSVYLVLAWYLCFVCQPVVITSFPISANRSQCYFDLTGSDVLLWLLL